MATHTLHTDKDCFYFVTFTCYKWLPLFSLTSIHDYMPEWIKHLYSRGLILCGYVIMPNHLHFLIYQKPNSDGLNKIIGTGKRFIAYEIVKRLKAQNRFSILALLSSGVRPNEQNLGKKHQVFQPSFDAKLCDSSDMIEDVLDYMHHNPVGGKWSLVDEFPDYRFSSASFYEHGIHSILHVTDYREILEQDLPS